MQAEAGLDAGLAYLREQAMDAHLAGDGSRVVYLATVALRGVKVASQAGADTKGIRWALYLGLYWMTSDDFLFSASGVGERLIDESDLPGDKALYDFLYENVKHPPIGGPVEAPALHASWLESACNDEPATVAVCFAVELMWWSAPHSEAWRQRITQLLEGVAPGSLMHVGLKRLAARLSVQQRICFTGQEVTSEDLGACTENHRELLVAEGWKCFYADDHSGLQTTIERLTAVTSTTDAEHSSLFYLAHFSRIQRRSSEDQFVGLERLRDSTRSQPSAAVAALRDLRFGRQYARVARSGFAGKQASARWDCLAISMLSQLAGLRSWHLAEWVTARRDTASVLVETACHGLPELAPLGIEAYVSSLDTPKTGEQPFFDATFQLLDAFPEDDRLTLVARMLSVPKAGEEAASRVLERLADAIPAEMLPEVAVWCNNVELRRHDENFWQSHLAWWPWVLHCSNGSAELAEALQPVAKEKAGSQFAWQDLGEFLSTYIIESSDEGGETVLSRLLEAEIDKTKVSFEGDRDAIVMNVAKHRTDLAKKCATWLRPRLEAKPNDLDSRWFLYQLDNLEQDWQTLIDDEGLRSLLVKKVLEACDKLAAEPPNQYSIVPYNYHVRFYECRWPILPSTLIDRLKSIVVDPETPLLNKSVFIACLAALCRNTASEYTEELAESAIELARAGVAGHDVFPESDGPLSTTRFIGSGAKSANYAVCRFLIAVAENGNRTSIERACGLVGQAKLLEADNVRPLAFQLALVLSARLAATEPTASLRLASMAESFALRVSDDQAEGMVYRFQDILFSRYVREPLASSRGSFEVSEAARLTWECWALRLMGYSVSASVRLRQAVATLLATCEAFGPARLTPPLTEALARLRNDSRMRVRHAAAPIDQTTFAPYVSS